MTEYLWDREATIRAYRAYLGLTQMQMADALGVSVRSYQNFENGRNAVPDGVFADIRELVANIGELAERIADKEHHELGDDPHPVALRAVGEALILNPDLRVTYASR